MAGMITPPEGDVARAVAGSNLTIVDRLRGMLIASTSPVPSATVAPGAGSLAMMGE